MKKFNFTKLVLVFAWAWALIIPFIRECNTTEIILCNFTVVVAAGFIYLGKRISDVKLTSYNFIDTKFDEGVQIKQLNGDYFRPGEPRA